MDKLSTDMKNGLLIYLKIDSIDDFKKLTINYHLINKVADYLYENKEKITFSKISELLNINRASIYNTYPKSKKYIQILIHRQKSLKQYEIDQLQNTKQEKNSFKIAKENNELKLDKEKIQQFMSIIMSLELENERKDIIINKLKLKISSLESTISQLKE